MTYELILPSSVHFISLHLSNEPLQSEDPSVKGGIVNRRPVGFSICVWDGDGCHSTFSWSLSQMIRISIKVARRNCPPEVGSALRLQSELVLSAATHHSWRGLRKKQLLSHMRSLVLPPCVQQTYLTGLFPKPSNSLVAVCAVLDYVFVSFLGHILRTWCHFPLGRKQTGWMWQLRLDQWASRGWEACRAGL